MRNDAFVKLCLRGLSSQLSHPPLPLQPLSLSQQTLGPQSPSGCCCGSGVRWGMLRSLFLQECYHLGALNPARWKSSDRRSCDGFGLCPPPAYPGVAAGMPSARKSLHTDVSQKIGRLFPACSLQVSTGLIWLVPLEHRARTLLPFPQQLCSWASVSPAGSVISQQKQAWDKAQISR